MTTRIDAQSTVPKANRAIRRRQSGFLPRWWYQCSVMPIIDSVNVTNTLIEYMTIRSDTFPLLDHRATIAATPISMMPLCEARRSDRLPNQCGTHES